MTEDRKFGVFVGGVFAVLGVALYALRDRPVLGGLLIALGSILLVLGIISPTLLTGLRTQWMRAGRAIGRVTTLLFLAAMYFLVLTPISICFRLAGRDVLNRRRRPGPEGSTWMSYSARVGNRAHFERMF